MDFYTKEYRKTPSRAWNYPCIVLVKDGWNDYGFLILYNLYIYSSTTDSIEIGNIKILDLTTTDTVLLPHFTALDSNKCSLGQSLEFYQNLQSALPDDFDEVLSALNDLVVKPELIHRFNDYEGYERGLLRFGTAKKALEEGAIFLRDGIRKVNDELAFRYTTRIGEAAADHEVNFNFQKTEGFPFRINVLIGKNGTGKTQFLGSMVNAISGIKGRSSFAPYHPFFNRVIAISYSLFDDFPKPKDTTVFSYKYIGLRTKSEEVVSDAVLEEKLKKALIMIYKDDRADEWYNAISKIIDLTGLGLANSKSLSEIWIEQISYKEAKRLSSGQSITLFILTELIAYIKEESLILFDEPETHLHPSAVGELMNSLHSILETYKSFSVISTHSPIVIQDVPSKYITVLEREGNMPIVRKLAMESFGESLSELTSMAFGSVEVKEFYKNWLEQIYFRNYRSLNAVDQLFENKLSLNARLYLAAFDNFHKDEKS